MSKRSGFSPIVAGSSSCRGVCFHKAKCSFHLPKECALLLQLGDHTDEGFFAPSLIKPPIVDEMAQDVDWLAQQNAALLFAVC